MQNSTEPLSLVHNYLGYSHHDCVQALLAADIESIAFGHWLAVPSQQSLLIFRHQQCVAIDCYQGVAQ